MSEANSYAGTIGAWVGGLIVLFTQLFLAYIAYCKGWSHLAPIPNNETNELLTMLTPEVRLMREAVEASQKTLENIEKIAVEVQNDAGGMLVIQRMPRSSTQTQDAAHPQQV